MGSGASSLSPSLHACLCGRHRMQRLTSITEQLRRKDCKTVIGLLTALTKNSSDQSKQKLIMLLRRWKQVRATCHLLATWRRLLHVSLPTTRSSVHYRADKAIELTLAALGSLVVVVQIDVNITEAANEAKDNVKYLFTLERFIEPLYSGAQALLVLTNAS